MCHAYFSMRFEFVIDILERRRIEIFINSCPEIVSHTFFNHCKAMTYEVALYVVCLLSVCLVNLRCPATSANSLLIRVLLSLPRHDDMMTTDFFLSFFFLCVTITICINALILSKGSKVIHQHG